MFLQYHFYNPTYIVWRRVELYTLLFDIALNWSTLQKPFLFCLGGRRRRLFYGCWIKWPLLLASQPHGLALNVYNIPMTLPVDLPWFSSGSLLSLISFVPTARRMWIWKYGHFCRNWVFQKCFAKHFAHFFVYAFEQTKEYTAYVSRKNEMAKKEGRTQPTQFKGGANE